MPRIFKFSDNKIPTPDGVVEIARKLADAAHAAINQKRKWVVPEQPYIVHPASVAKALKNAGMSEIVIAAAWLHDTAEDTKLTLEEIESICGTDVAMLVSEVTDMSLPEDGNREIRKAMDVKHAAEASFDGQMIKMADMLDNLSSIVEYAPDFALIWINEKIEMVGVLDKLSKENISTLFVELNKAKTKAESFGLNEWLRSREIMQCRKP